MNQHVMDADIGHTRLDAVANGALGAPVNRYEGALKVTGQAPYAYEQKSGKDIAYGFLLTAPCGPAHIENIETEAAEKMPGVLSVLTGEKMPRASALPMGEKPAESGTDIHHFGQPLAFVVAESFEEARHAAGRITLQALVAKGRHDLSALKDDTPIAPDGLMPGNVERGDFEAAFKAAPVQIDSTYTTPSHHSAAMEPQAAIAEWNGEQLTVFGSCQLVEVNVGQIAAALDIPADNVRLISPYVGGGFGNKLGISADIVLAARAARELGRPVKVALTRQAVFQTTSRRSETIQRVRLGASEDGQITAIAHEIWCANSPGNSFFEPAGVSTVFLYAGENRCIRHYLAETDVLMTAAVRAPGEASGMLALESAMDELANALGIDPVDLRKRNEPKVDPQDDKPFSARNLVACMDEGAKRFGWMDRPKVPASRREGQWLIGYGMAAASRANSLMAASADVTLSSNGRASVRTAMTDIGTGTYTILQQITAEMLGLPLDKIEVTLGDSTLPPSSGSGGSWGANSSGSAVFLACEAIIADLASKLGVEPADVTMSEGHVIAGNRRHAIADLLGGADLTMTGSIKPGATSSDYNQASYGAHFCEVAVNAITGETRVKRLLTVAAAGRIFNEKTATSQCYGGQIWGIGAALMEGLDIDPRSGLIVNHDLAHYHVPANADVGALDVVFLPERDGLASPLAAKGVGELALAGVGAAITNAIYNACGVRVRDYPATPDKILAGLPDIA